MNLLTVSWEKVGTEKVYLDDVMGKKGLVSVDETGDVMGDYINTWNYEVGSWGETYYYINQPSWNFEEGGKLIDYTDTWMGANSGYPENPEMTAGSSFWLYHIGDDIEALPFAGQVTAGAPTYTLMAGQMNLCGNPFASELDLRNKSQVKITGATSVDEEGNVMGDYINTWDLTVGSWGETYYYINQPSWNFEEGGKLIDYTDTWMGANSGYPENTAIQPGAGFWYYAKENNVTLAFENPVK